MASSVHCGPCGHDNIKKDAENWCTDCNEGFCYVCEKAHQSMKMLRHHSCIPIGEYLKLESVNVVVECEEHGSKFEMYCKNHEQPICIECFQSKHKGCDDVVIPLKEAATNVKTSTAFADLEHSINHTLENIQECVKDRKTAADRIEIQEKEIKKFITDTRESIDNHLDDLERKSLNELTTTYSACKSKYCELDIKLGKIEQEIKRLKEKLCQLKRFNTEQEVFISTHQMTKEINEEVEVIKEAIRSVKNYNIEIKIHQRIASLFKDINRFASIKVNESTMNCPFVDAKIDQAQIPVKTEIPFAHTYLQFRKKFPIKQTGSYRYISGCTTLANGNYLIADYNGQNVIMEYNEDGNFIRDIPVSAHPWDLTVIDADRIAVSYHSLCYIEIIDIRNKGNSRIPLFKSNKEKIIVMKTVKFENSCDGISYSDEKIYVVVKDEGIKVLDMKGNKHTSIVVRKNVKSVAATKARIYYTLDNCVVCCCSTTRETIWSSKLIYIVQSLPGGIAVDHQQNVFVADVHAHNLQMIQDHGILNHEEVLNGIDGLLGPRCVCYDNKNNLLLVCNQSNGVAFLFSIMNY